MTMNPFVFQIFLQYKPVGKVGTKGQTIAANSLVSHYNTASLKEPGIGQDRSYSYFGHASRLKRQKKTLALGKKKREMNHKHAGLLTRVISNICFTNLYRQTFG